MDRKIRSPRLEDIFDIQVSSTSADADSHNAAHQSPFNGTFIVEDEFSNNLSGSQYPLAPHDHYNDIQFIRSYNDSSNYSADSIDTQNNRPRSRDVCIEMVTFIKLYLFFVLFIIRI